jgi:hypothetical protein
MTAPIVDHTDHADPHPADLPAPPDRPPPPGGPKPPWRRGPLARVFGVLAVIVALATIGYGSLALLDQLAQRTYRSTASYPLTTKLVLQVGNADVHVVADAGDRIIVSRTIRRGFAHAHSASSVRGGDLVVDDGCDERSMFPCTMTTTIHVPRHIDTSGHVGEGSLSIEGVTGSLDLSSGDGDVSVDTVNGPLRLDSGDGDVDLRNVSAPTAAISTGDGDVRVDFTTAPESVLLTTGDGDVDVCLPPDTPAYAVSTHSGDGDVVNRIPSNPSSSRTLQLSSGDGDVSLRLC